MRIRVLMIFAALTLAVSPAFAQVTETIPLPPETQKVTLGWDKPVTGDPVTGYEIVFANTVQNGSGNIGQQIKTIPVNDPTALSLEVENAMLPTVKEFYASIRAVSGSLKSVHSNTLLFRRATAPGAPGNFRGVVAVGQASSDKPGSGDVTADSLTPTLGVTIHANGHFESNSPSFSQTDVGASGLRWWNQDERGRFESQTSSQPPK